MVEGSVGWIAGHLLFTDIGTQGLFPFVSKDNILQASIGVL